MLRLALPGGGSIGEWCSLVKEQEMPDCNVKEAEDGSLSVVWGWGGRAKKTANLWSASQRLSHFMSVSHGLAAAPTYMRLSRH